MGKACDGLKTKRNFFRGKLSTGRWTQRLLFYTRAEFSLRNTTLPFFFFSFFFPSQMLTTKTIVAGRSCFFSGPLYCLGARATARPCVFVCLCRHYLHSAQKQLRPSAALTATRGRWEECESASDETPAPSPSLSRASKILVYCLTF